MRPFTTCSASILKKWLLRAIVCLLVSRELLREQTRVQRVRVLRWLVRALPAQGRRALRVRAPLQVREQLAQRVLVLQVLALRRRTWGPIRRMRPVQTPRTRVRQTPRALVRRTQTLQVGTLQQMKLLPRALLRVSEQALVARHLHRRLRSLLLQVGDTPRPRTPRRRHPRLGLLLRQTPCRQRVRQAHLRQRKRPTRRQPPQWVGDTPRPRTPRQLRLQQTLPAPHLQQRA